MGLLVTEAAGSWWAGTRGARRQVGQGFLAVVVFLAVFSGGASGVSAPVPTPYTLAEAFLARAFLSTVGRPISIEGDGLYTIRLWLHAEDTFYPLPQTSLLGRGVEIFTSTSERNVVVGLLINTQGTQLPIMLDLSATSTTQANATLSGELIDHPQTAFAITANSVEGIMLQGREGALHGPPDGPGPLRVFPSQENDYVFLVCIPDWTLLPRTTD